MKTPMLKSLFKNVVGPQQRTPFVKNNSGGCFYIYCTHMMSHAILIDEITDIMISIKKINKS